MKLKKLKVTLFFIISSLTFSQMGQSGRFEYEVYSSGGNSSFIAADTLGMNSDEKATIKDGALNGTPSSNNQPGRLEYEVYSAGGNSSFIAADTLGVSSDEKNIIEDTALNGTPSGNKQSGLFEHKSYGLGGNSSLVNIDASGFNEKDREKHLEASNIPSDKSDNEKKELDLNINSELVQNK